MKYTKNQREQLCEVFKKAKVKLKNRKNRGRDQYICFAIYDMLRSEAISETTYILATDLIRCRLCGWNYYEQWLYSNHPELYQEVVEDQTSSRIKAYNSRQAWLDSLVKEFSI